MATVWDRHNPPATPSESQASRLDQRTGAPTGGQVVGASVGITPATSAPAASGAPSRARVGCAVRPFVGVEDAHALVTPSGHSASGGIAVVSRRPRDRRRGFPIMEAAVLRTEV